MRHTEGSGSVLITWRTPATFEPRFGAASAEQHVEAGHTLLRDEVPTLRRDVDTAEQMRAAYQLGLGPRTTALLAAARARTAA